MLDIKPGAPRGIGISNALFRREEEYEMDLWVVKYASLRCKSKLVMSGSGKLEMSALMGSGGLAGGPDRDERERDQAVGGIEGVGGWGVEPA